MEALRAGSEAKVTTNRFIALLVAFARTLALAGGSLLSCEAARESCCNEGSIRRRLAARGSPS